MANATRPAPVISERVEIHKGCKSLETLVNVLNDYCEAASAIVALQKKLVKALREAASLKCTTEIAANALNTSAAIFETLSDVDAKFAKVADKECDGLSNEVKKWFKKLAKEEKAHDDRITAANARIKQAGQSYEKKSKKNSRDAVEEHARYINLLSVLGPEMSQEKYNHALFVTQRYTSTTYNVAASLSRIADAEWLRSCEGVRRFAPTVGQLGEWRALCEGGWVGEIPKDLDPDGASKPQVDLSAKAYEARPADARDDSTRLAGSEQGQRTPSGQYTPLEQPPPLYNAANSALERQQPSHSTDGSIAERSRSVEEGPGRSSPQLALESFPAPPKHFPLPPVSTGRPGSAGPSSPTRLAPDSIPDSQSQPQSQTSSSVSHASFTALPRVAESPLEEVQASIPAPGANSAASSTSSDAQPKDEAPAQSPDTRYGETDDLAATIASPRPTQGRRPLPDISSYQQDQEKGLSISGTGTVRDGYPKGDFLDDREFGVKTNGTGDEKGKGVDSITKLQDLSRRDSLTSNGSVVASMRSRYDRTAVSASPPPKDMPRLPLSVSDLANKYQSQGGEDRAPTSPRPRPLSPPAERAMSYAGESGRYRMPMAEPGIRERTMTMISEGRHSDVDEFARRRQRVEELELREKELVLREKERELEERVRALDRDRARVLSPRGDGHFPDEGTQTYRSQYDAPRTALPHRYSYSTTQLVAPGSQHEQQRSRSRPTTPNDPPTDHAPYCGCDRCSASKYRAPNVAPSPRDLRPPERPITLRPEKPKGWIRRLSMPVVVGNAFSLDSKKNGSNASLASRRSVADESGRLTNEYGSNRAIASSARR